MFIVLEKIQICIRYVLDIIYKVISDHFPERMEDWRMEKMDRRVRKTRALLLQGLVKMMETHDIQDISVKELTELVDISIAEPFICIMMISTICSIKWKMKCSGSSTRSWNRNR